MLTAVEAFLFSLYGYRQSGDPPPETELTHETSSSQSRPLQTDTSQPDSEQSVQGDNGCTNHNGGLLKDPPNNDDTAERTNVSLNLQTSNSSSSSSVAEDWIVSQISSRLEPSFSLCGDQSCTQTPETGSDSKTPERVENDAVPGADTSRDQISAEDWSRGTALTDPVSGEPLQPVKIIHPSKNNHPDSNEFKSHSSSNKKMLNAITEKRAALTAYDLISNRAMRAPPSPAALFEKEARAEVLREKPTASLQDISAAVDQRWKNLGEEDRKK